MVGLKSGIKHTVASRALYRLSHTGSANIQNVIGSEFDFQKF